MDSYIYNLGIHILLVIYFIINIYYKKYFNLVLITSLFGILFFIIQDYKNALVIAYIISIIYGIYKNFYLIENFNSKEKELDIRQDENTVELVKENRTRHSRIHTKDEIKLQNFDIKSLINDEILDYFMQDLKKNHISIIYNKKVNVEHLNPTLKELNLKKINNMKENNNILAKPIIISNDNFIIDGHHRWYSITSNNNESYMNNKHSVKKNMNLINVTMINLSVSEIIKRIKSFKYNFNKTAIKNSTIDKKRLKQSRELLDQIKNNVNKLDKYFMDIDSIKLI